MITARLGAMLATAALAAALGGCASSSGGGSSSVQDHGTLLEGAALPAAPAPPIELRDQDGNPLSLASLHGHVVVLTFLGTDCGAACRVIAQQIRGALDELPAGAAKVVIVSAEPRADSESAAQAFLGHNDLAGRASFLLGTAAELRPLYAAYRVHPPESQGRRQFGEYAFVMLIDAAGRERALFETAQLTPEALAADIRKLAG